MSEKQDKRRKDILAAALRAFSEKGYDKTSIDDVVRVTGYSKGTIYWYFENKQVLFTALMEFVVDQMFTRFDEVFSSVQTMTPHEAIAAIFQGVDALLDMNPKVASLTVDFMLQGLHYPDMQKKYGEYYARYIDELGAIIQRGIDAGKFRPVDARSAAAALIGMGDGVMLQALIADQISLDWQWEVKNILKTAEMLFMNGLVKGGASDDE
jgi:AcrR family transcriptional regulator